jgi:hypothetical protein
MKPVEWQACRSFRVQRSRVYYIKRLPYLFTELWNGAIGARDFNDLTWRWCIKDIVGHQKT